MKTKKYEIDMCNGPILKKMLLFAIPLICSSILQLLFNAADVIVVGHFAGDHALAAVGSNSSLIHLFVNFFMGLSVGANVLVARCYGAKQQKQLSRTVHTAITLSLVCGLVLAILGVFVAPEILRLMHTPKEILPLSVIYLRVYFLGVPALMIYNFGAAILRAVGDTKRPLRYLVIAGIINVSLNLLFVIVFHWSIFGVALATTISQIISATLILRCLMKESGGIRVELNQLHIYKDEFLKMIRIGLPTGLQSSLFSFSNILIQSSINSFGATVVAGSSAASNIEGFVYTSMVAFSQANLSFTSQNVGAGKKERLNPILFTASGCVIILGTAMGGMVYLCGPALLSLYTNSKAVIAAGMIRLAFICVPYALAGMMEVVVGSLRGLGYAVFPMIVSLVGSCLLRVVWLQTIFQMEAFHRIETVYVVYPISWVITLLAHIVTYIIVYRRYVRK